MHPEYISATPLWDNSANIGTKIIRIFYDSGSRIHLGNSSVGQLCCSVATHARWIRSCVSEMKKGDKPLYGLVQVQFTSRNQQMNIKKSGHHTYEK